MCDFAAHHAHRSTLVLYLELLPGLRAFFKHSEVHLVQRQNKSAGRVNGDRQ